MNIAPKQLRLNRTGNNCTCNVLRLSNNLIVQRNSKTNNKVGK